MTPQAIHELKEAAEAAETDFDRVQISVGGGMRATKTVPAYIALANPATIKALIADYERMREALDELLDVLGADELDRDAVVPSYRKARAALRAARGEAE